MARVRLVATTVSLQLVNDDGETLAPLNVSPLVVPAADWPPDLDAVIADVDRQVNPPPPEETV